jgi:glyoxylase-like metal-dependent hydrolase (beta-lactamase superfamily II)
MSADLLTESATVPFAIRGECRPTGHGLQLLPNLFLVSWLRMNPGLIDCHVYVLRGPQGLLLLDCGTPWAHEQIRRNFDYWNLDFKQVRCVLLTHAHHDHALGGFLFKQLGVEILAHPQAIARTEAEWRLFQDGGLPAVQRAANESHERDPANAYHVDGSVSEADRLSRCGFEIDVFHTPGHTASCVSYLIEVDGQRCLFSGDLLMSDGLPGFNGDLGFSRENIMNSLRRMRDVKFAHLCHGHDALMDDNGRLFRESIARAERWKL